MQPVKRVRLYPYTLEAIPSDIVFNVSQYLPPSDFISFLTSGKIRNLHFEQLTLLEDPALTPSKLIFLCKALNVDKVAFSSCHQQLLFDLHSKDPLADYKNTYENLITQYRFIDPKRLQFDKFLLQGTYENKRQREGGDLAGKLKQERSGDHIEAFKLYRDLILKTCLPPEHQVLCCTRGTLEFLTTYAEAKNPKFEVQAQELKDVSTIIMCLIFNYDQGIIVATANRELALKVIKQLSYLIEIDAFDKFSLLDLTKTLLALVDQVVFEYDIFNGELVESVDLFNLLHTILQKRKLEPSLLVINFLCTLLGEDCNYSVQFMYESASVNLLLTSFCDLYEANTENHEIKEAFISILEYIVCLEVLKVYDNERVLGNLFSIATAEDLDLTLATKTTSLLEWLTMDDDGAQIALFEYKGSSENIMQVVARLCEINDGSHTYNLQLIDFLNQLCSYSVQASQVFFSSQHEEFTLLMLKALLHESKEDIVAIDTISLIASFCYNCSESRNKILACEELKTVLLQAIIRTSKCDSHLETLQDSISELCTSDQLDIAWFLDHPDIDVRLKQLLR
jgi:hypothetical protein